MNYKARLIRKLESARLHDPGKYSALAKEHNIKHSKFNTLPIKELREIVGGIGG